MRQSLFAGRSSAVVLVLALPAWMPAGPAWPARSGTTRVQDGAAAVDLVRERAAAIVATPSTDYAPPPRTVDVVHYAIHLALDAAARRIEGHAELQLRPFGAARRSIVLDADGLEVRAVKLGDAALEWDHRGTELTIDLGREVAPDESVALRVDYGATPVRGLFFSPAADGSCRMVWSQNQCTMASAWFPCRDDPDDRASSELFVTLQDAWRTVGNGVLIESNVLGDGRRTDHWRMDFPHPVFLTSLVAGPLVEIDLGRLRDLPLWGYALPERAADVAAALQPTGRMIELLEAFAGVPYPFPVYRQACVTDFPWGGMENVAASTLDQDDLHRAQAPPEARRATQALLVHEIAHQWFGDLVTPAGFADLWLAEGFATFAELLWLEHEEGSEAAAVAWCELQERLAAARGADPRPLVSSRCRELDDLFTATVYEGGAAFLRLLRARIGDEPFGRAVRQWIARGLNRSVSSAEFEAVVAEAAGRDLAPFFAELLHAPGQPQLECEWRFDGQARRLELIAHQKQAGEGVPEVFHLPLAVAWECAAGRRTTTIELDARRCRVAVDCDERPRFVRFNDGGALPGVVRTEQTPEEWRAQLAEDDDPAGRRDAARALGEAWAALPAEPDPARAATLAALARAVIEERQPGVRAAAAAALGVTREIAARGALASALFDREPAVRAAAAEALGAFEHDDEAGGSLVRRLQSEEDETVIAALAEALGGVYGAEASEPLHRLATNDKNDVALRGAALAAAAKAADRLAADARATLRATAIAEAAPDRPLPRRAGAITALARLARFEPEAAAQLAALLDDPSPKVRALLLGALADAGDGGGLPESLLPALVAFHDRAALPDQRSVARVLLEGLLATAAD